MADVLTSKMRDVLIEHIDGPVAINRSLSPRRAADGRHYQRPAQVERARTVTALVVRGLLSFNDPTQCSGGPAMVPKHTWITLPGRRRLAELLADYADAIVRERQRRERADSAFAPGLPERAVADLIR